MATRIVPVRIDQITMQQIAAAIDAANAGRRDAPYDTSAWIRSAIHEKLRHLRRAKKQRRTPTTQTRIYSIDIQTKIDAIGSEPVIAGQDDYCTLYRFADGIECIETNGPTIWEHDTDFEAAKESLPLGRLN